MSYGEKPEAGQAAAWHSFLLRLSGHLPDDLMAQCRSWLAEGRIGNVAQALHFGILQYRVLLTEDETEVFCELLKAHGVDANPVRALSLTDFASTPQFLHAFRDSRGTDEDGIDAAAVAAVTAQPEAVGLWRAWRHPYDRAPWPPPRRVFLLEMRDERGLPDITARLQQALAEAGEPSPQVEVYPTGAALAFYQQMARGYGELLWAATPEHEIPVAAVFDQLDPADGPSFDPQHPRLDNPFERRRILNYLNTGEPLLVTAALMDDIVDPSRGAVVPMSFRTDGTWIWTDTTTYYLREHLLKPESALLAHIRQNRYLMPTVDGAAAHRALAILQKPDADEAAPSYEPPPGHRRRWPCAWTEVFRISDRSGRAKTIGSR
jgi:hypothetical protein